MAKISRRLIDGLIAAEERGNLSALEGHRIRCEEMVRCTQHAVAGGEQFPAPVT